MESGIQSSFIPHDAAEPEKAPRVRGEASGLSDLLLLVAVVMFVASAALAGAVFLYDQYLQSSAAAKVESLKRAREAFEPTTIQEIMRLDSRMRVAEQVLGQHMAPTAFFQALQLATLSTVSFETLSLVATDPLSITVEMSGIAQSVNSIALQADLFSKNGVITSPIFSDITREVDGVHFKLKALVNPAAINYVRLIAGLVSAQGIPQSAQQNIPTTPPPSPFGPAPEAPAAQ